MLQAIQDKSVNVLETIIQRLESYEALQKRPRVFAREPFIQVEDARVDPRTIDQN